MPSSSNAITIVIFTIIGICIAMVIVKFWTRYECSAEGFADIKSPVTGSCPRGSKSYADPTGAINCCSGTVNGNVCEGTVKCTFSGSLTNKYPLCGRTRHRKFTGDIYPFVKQIVESNPDVFFSQVLPIMKDMKNQLKSLVPAQLSDASYKKYIALVDEEDMWANDLTNEYRKGMILYDDVLVTIQEEIMYIFNSVMGIFQGQPIASNRDLIQKQFQDQICKKA